jgi:hypothetical protein
MCRQAEANALALEEQAVEMASATPVKPTSGG